MAEYDASLNYYGSQPIQPSSKRKKIGGTILGGLVGMTAYYLPVSKDTFVNEATSITKSRTNAQIKLLKKAAEEIKRNKLSTSSEIFLQEVGVGKNISAIANKCKTLEHSINDTDAIKTLKTSFEKTFTDFKVKKQSSLLDNTTSKAYRNIKWDGFKWGAGICASLGLAMGLLASRD